MKKSRVFIAVLLAFFVQSEVPAQQDWPLKKWKEATPQSQGMNVDSLNAFDKDIANGKYGPIDDMVVTRHGKLVYQKKYSNDYYKLYGDSLQIKSALNPHDPGGPYNYYNPWWHPYYHKGDLHSLQSVSKTITSVIIGVAMARNEFPALSTTVLSFFDTTLIKDIDERKRKITLQHLLTMTAGFDWNEQVDYNDPRNDCTIMEASFDWIQYVINRPMSNEPGKLFNYNSGASQLLAYIFSKATGKDIEEYAAQYLFSPLGITEYYWKRIPYGLADTEGGLYLKATDLAKIYYLFLRNGNWNGKQIVTKEWVKASVTSFIKVTSTIQYGYKWWLYAYGKDNSKQAWAGSGFGGQWPIILPEYDIVVVFTGWNIKDGLPFLRPTEAIRRIVAAVSVK